MSVHGRISKYRVERIQWNSERKYICAAKKRVQPQYTKAYKDHILLRCEKARTLWVLLLSMFGVQWVLPATVKEMLLGWNGTFVGKKRKGVWRASPLRLFWTVWKARNKVAFEEEELSIQRLKFSFVYFLWSKTKLSIKDGSSTLVDFVGWMATR